MSVRNIQIGCSAVHSLTEWAGQGQSDVGQEGFEAAGQCGQLMHDLLSKRRKRIS